MIYDRFLSCLGLILWTWRFLSFINLEILGHYFFKYWLYFSSKVGFRHRLNLPFLFPCLLNFLYLLCLYLSLPPPLISMVFCSVVSVWLWDFNFSYHFSNLGVLFVVLNLFIHSVLFYVFIHFMTCGLIYRNLFSSVLDRFLPK